MGLRTYKAPTKTVIPDFVREDYVPPAHAMLDGDPLGDHERQQAEKARADAQRALEHAERRAPRKTDVRAAAAVAAAEAIDPTPGLEAIGEPEVTADDMRAALAEGKLDADGEPVDVPEPKPAVVPAGRRGDNSAWVRVDEAKGLVATVDTSYVKLVYLIKQMRDERTHTKVGYDDIRLFYETELGLKYSKANYFYKIATAFESSGVEEDELGRLGWSKAKELVTQPQESLKGLVAMFLSDPVRWSVTAIQDYLAGTATPGPEKRPEKRLVFDETSKVTYEEALAAARPVVEQRWDPKERGDVPESVLLEHILGEWMQYERKNLTLQDHLSILERTFKVKLKVE